MKVLRVTATNLNSLYGENCVDLEASLAGASLFLIYGPTGSGKSSLMDAVSLALFGVTPRLTGERNKPEADPAAIMSRGTGECSAEVVFTKSEGRVGGRRTYRARWSCWRARKKPDGATQPPERSLERLESGGDWRSEDGWELLMSSRKAKEFAPVFAKVLEDFGVADFNRSMLLAQGQFDAFLSAPADERAGILERLTETSIYKRLGERASRMQTAHSNRINDLRVLATAEGGLDAEALDELKAEHSQNVSLLKSAQEKHGAAKSRLDWFEEDHDLQGKVRKSEVREKQLGQDLLAEQGVLEQLTEHERCEDVEAFERYDAFHGADERVKKLSGKLAALELNLPGLEKDAEETERSHEEIKRNEQLAREQLEQLRPLGSGATDAELNEGNAKKAEEAACGRRDAAQSKVAEAREQLTASRDAEEGKTAQVKDAEEDIATHGLDAQLAEEWELLRPRLDKLVSTAEGLADDAASMEKERAELASEREALALDLRDQDKNRDASLKTPKENLSRAREALKARLGDTDVEVRLDELSREVDAKRERLDALRDARPALIAAREAAADQVREEAALADLSRQLQAGQATLAKLRETRDGAAERNEQTQKAWERTKKVAELAGARASLTDGEECPLCGAEDHPWAADDKRKDEDARLHEILEEAERELEETRAALVSAEDAFRKAEKETEGKQGKLELGDEQVARAREKHAGLNEQAASVLERLRLAPDCSIEQFNNELQAVTREAVNAKEALDELQKARREADRAARELMDAEEALVAAAADLAERGVKLEARGEQLEKDSRAHDGERRAASESRSSCRSELEAQGLELDSDEPTAWRAEVMRRVKAHAARLAKRDSLRGELATLSAERKKDEKSLDDITGQLGKVTKETEEAAALHVAAKKKATAARARLMREWEHLLAPWSGSERQSASADEASPAELIEDQEAWCKTLRETLESASEQAKVKTSQLSAARKQYETLSQGLVDLEQERAAAKVSLEISLARLSLDGAESLLALRLEKVVLEGARAKRSGLERRRVELDTELRERRSALKEHRAERPTDLTLEGNEGEDRERLKRALEEAGHELESATEAQGETDGRLRAHEDAVQRKAEYRTQLEDAEADARVWQQLHECIGVRDGGRFKEFAQALNLGQLLEKANIHLARLEPRYSLVPRLEDGLPTLEFDVSDLWQVGARVAPRSLSGGERFLVSLALALGLSDFRSVKMPIETLLLDEGFGTLDSDTLNVALGALSQLQSDGRQVGIISHVVGLHEKIEARVEVKQLGGGRSQVQVSA